MISLGVATIVYLALFRFIGYLSIPVGVVISGYVKNYLLGHVCRKRELVKTDKKTIFSTFVFMAISVVLGIFISNINITSVWVLGMVIALFGIIYLPIAFIIDRFIIK